MNTSLYKKPPIRNEASPSGSSAALSRSRSEQLVLLPSLRTRFLSLSLRFEMNLMAEKVVDYSGIRFNYALI